MTILPARDGFRAAATLEDRSPVQAATPALWTSHAADACLGAALAATALLSHPYGGITADARVYLGRALADVDPQGVGRDVMFRYDGQSGFTLFRPLAALCAAHLGIAATNWLLGVAGFAAYGVAVVCCIRTLRTGRAVAVVIAAALLLPRSYTSFEIVAAGEALAIPRPFAEALVLFAIARLATGRPRSAFVLVACAATIHPIMALPGLALLALVVGFRHRALMVAAAVVGVALAAVAGAPLVARAFTRLDPEWLDVLRHRNAYLFMSNWDEHGWSKIVVMAATILVAARSVPPVWARIFHATLAVAVLGCLASFVGVDGLSSVLFAQAQLWRSLWLLAAMAPVAAGIGLVALPSQGWQGRATLALLAAGWMSPLLAPANGLVALLALALAHLPATAIRDIVYKAVVAGAALVAVASLGFGLRLVHAFVQIAPPDMPIETSLLWTLGLGGFAALALVAWLATSQLAPAARLGCTAAFLVVSCALVLTRYDERSPFERDIDAAIVKPDLVAALARRPGEVLWLGDDALWYWTRRPNWNSKLQGAGLVFSRDLAHVWHDRARAVVDAGLAGEDLLEPWKAGLTRGGAAYDAAGVAALCARSDAPAWIVMPLDEGSAVPADPGLILWSAPVPFREIVPGRDGLVLHASSRRLLIPCRRVQAVDGPAHAGRLAPPRLALRRLAPPSLAPPSLAQSAAR